MADDLALGADETVEELDESTEESTEETVNEEESTEESTTEEEEGTNEEEETTDETSEAGPKLDASPTWKQVTTKYPKLFKDFPGLKHTFFHAQEYRKVFSSVEEAKEAAEELENFTALNKSLTSGDVEDLTSAIKSFDEDTILQLGSNFLPALKKADPEAYYSAITPELTNFCRTLYDYGVRNENDNMKNAALVAAQHFFGDSKVASGEKVVATKEPKKDNALEEERRKFRAERYTTLYNDVVQDANSQLEQSIADGLDPKNVMSDAMREMVIERISKEINKILNADKSHTGKMSSLWKKADSDGFNSSHKSKIVKAYLERAREIMPSIRSKIRSAALGTKTRKSETDSTASNNGRKEPLNTAGGGANKNNSKALDAKNIDWRKSSDLDILNDRVTFKD